MDYTYKSILVLPDFQAIHDGVDMSAMTDKLIDGCTWHEDTFVRRKGYEMVKDEKGKLKRQKRKDFKGEKGVLIVTWDGELSEDDKTILDGIVANI